MKQSTDASISIVTDSQGKYVRVIGTMKSFNNKRSVNATVCNLVTDFNEVQYHLLEVMYVHLYHTRGPPVSSLPAAEEKGHTNVHHFRRTKMATGRQRCKAFRSRTTTKATDNDRRVWMPIL